jgi:putative transposase
MKDLYSVSSYSKQALHKYRKRCEQNSKVKEQVVSICSYERKKHKQMSCRRIHTKHRDSLIIGRDIFEQIGFANGFKIKQKRSAVKTTWSQKMEVYANLLEGRILTGVNQAWQSDIFYLKVEGVDYYGVTIIDVYSRLLLSVHLSKSLQAEETSKAFKQAVAKRKGEKIKGCIFHSDRGSQYISDKLKEKINYFGLLPSMCKLPQENAYVERVQGTLKHEYLFHFPLTEANLQNEIKKIIQYYNYDRPHSELNMLSPAAFEDKIKSLNQTERPVLKIYQWEHPVLIKLMNNKNQSIA